MVGFQDIIGHDEIIHHLKETIRTGKVSHSRRDLAWSVIPAKKPWGKIIRILL